MTNNASEFDSVVLIAKKTIGYIAIIKKPVKRSTNINVNIYLIFLSNIKNFSNPDSAFGF
jgi:hypothetical protein